MSKLRTHCSFCGKVCAKNKHSKPRCRRCARSFQKTKEYKLERILIHAKARAAKYSRVFALTVPMLVRLLKRQEGKCALSGRVLKHPGEEDATMLNTMSLDRIDSKGGYTEGNVQFVTTAVNRAKSNYSEQEFWGMIEELYERRKKVNDDELREQQAEAGVPEDYDEMSEAETAELERRIADTDCPIRFVIVSKTFEEASFGPLYFNMEDETWCSDKESATLFKRKKHARAILLTMKNKKSYRILETKKEK